MRRFLLLLPVLLLAACGSSDEPAAGADAAKPDAAGAPQASTGAATDIAGQYTVTGTNIDGSAYEGTLAVARQGGAYTFAWTAGESYAGVGVQQGDFVAVGFGAPECGAAAYQMTDTGLDGVWALPGGGPTGTEQATRSGGSAGSAAGQYTTTGTNPDGGPYTGGLSIEQQGSLYALSWGEGAESSGVGLVEGTNLGSTYGPDGCGLAVYRVQAGGALAGTWTDASFTGTGTEQATRM